MDGIFNSLVACFCGHNIERNEDEKEHLINHENPSEYQINQATSAVAADFVTALCEAETSDHNLKTKLHEIVGATGWRESLAMAILSRLINAIEQGTPMSKAAAEALERAMKDALQWAKEHPHIVLCTIVALGILVIMTPWVIEVLGFAAEGPVANTFAAWWQARYAGYVPKGSLFSFFQRLGMVWKRGLRL